MSPGEEAQPCRARQLLPSLLPLLLPHGALAGAAPPTPAAAPAGAGTAPAPAAPPPAAPGATDIASLVSGPAPPLHAAFRDAAALSGLIQRLPKMELHLHIEGTFEPDLLLRLAARNGVALPYADETAARAARAHYSCLQDFLDIYLACTDALVTEEDFYELARDYLARAAAENVRGAEVFLDAQGHMARGVPMEAMVRGLSRAFRESPVDGAVILCLQRELGPASAAAALDAARPHLHSAVVGLGLAGAEVGNPPALFQEVFRAAAGLGLHLMAHAGEEGGPGNVADAIRLLGVERVDHGIRALEDPALVAVMADSRLPITFCPLSNLRLQVYKGQLEERVREVLASGIKVTINSDDPAYFGSYVNGNYEWVARVAGLGPDDLAALAVNSFEASFLPPERKAAHVAEVKHALVEWKHEQLLAEQN